MLGSTTLVTGDPRAWNNMELIFSNLAADWLAAQQPADQKLC